MLPPPSLPLLLVCVCESVTETHRETHINLSVSVSCLSALTMWLQDVFVGLNLSGVLLLTFVTLLILDLLKNRNPPNYPPGPLALPLVGNVFNIDPRQPHIYLTKVGLFLPYVSVLFHSTWR